MPDAPRIRRGRPSGSKRVRVREASNSQYSVIREQDKEMAKAVCQVVNNLVCQVADEPYGDLTRKRPSFVNVLRKFVKDSVQAYHDQTMADIMHDLFKRHKQDDEHEYPYGIDLVWGIVLAEMAKSDRKERIRQNNMLKCARRRELKRKEAEEAAREIRKPTWDEIMYHSSRSCSSDDEDHRMQKPMEAPSMPNLTNQPTRSGMISSSSSEDNLERYSNKRLPPKLTAVPPMMSTSEDSDWTVRPKKQSKSAADATLEGADTLHGLKKMPNYPMFEKRRGTPTIGRPRGRGRGRGGGVQPTVRSLLDAAMETALSTAPMSSSSLEPQNEAIAPMLVVSRGPVRRGSRGSRGMKGRGARTSGQRLIEEWDVDADEYQQHLLAETIETSGGSASQESLDEMSTTINEVVARVNSMSELDWEKKVEKEREEAEEKTKAKEAKVAIALKRRLSKAKAVSKSVPKKRKRKEEEEEEEEVLIVDSDEDERIGRKKERATLHNDIDRWIASVPRLAVTSIPIEEGDGSVSSSQSSIHTAQSMMLVLDDETKEDADDEAMTIDSATHSTIDLVTEMSPGRSSTSEVMIVDSHSPANI